MLKVISYQISDNIDLKALKKDFKGTLEHSSIDELFYVAGPRQYIYVFKYGVVCFLNFDEIKITEFIKFAENYCKDPFETSLSDEFMINDKATANKFGHNIIAVKKPDMECLRLIMLNVSQSVALDYYSEQSTSILEETKSHSSLLEQKGSMDISGKKLKKFIGRSMNLKNKIAENLYIFDSPPEAWENENLSKIDQGLKKTFDLQMRYRDIKEDLEIIKENLDLFRDLMQHKDSTVLEWIVIALIVVEVIYPLIEHFFLQAHGKI